ncbi:MAG: outer membrane beta-barrel protein [Bryobacterales bacterium]|nr:outer membrane beta-barrel protein [Bryobacterales bacterium]MDE0628383.1 outer membrane beta-barrel protein [Bryobacterales bacterium]
MRTFFLSCIAVMLLAPPAQPQSAELGISGGYGSLGDNSVSEIVQVGNAAQTEEFNLSNGIRIGGRMAFNSRAFFGHEVSYSYQHARLSYIARGPEVSGTQEYGAVRSHHMYYNLVLHATPTDTRLRPFVTGGGGFSSYFLPGISSFSGYGNTKFGYNYGGGLKINFFPYGIRFDVRNHVTGKPFGQYIPNVEGTLKNLEISMTFSLLM